MSPKEIEDQLIQLLKNETNREEIIRRCATFIRNNRGNWEDAKEIFFQAVFSVLSKARKKEIAIKGDNLPAYLNGVCRNLWITKLRKGKDTLPIVDLNGKEISIPDTDSKLAEKIEKENRSQMMYKCLNQLKERCKKVLDSFYWEKKSYREIAEMLEITEANARKIAERCRESLKKCIKKNEGSNGHGL